MTMYLTPYLVPAVALVLNGEQITEINITSLKDDNGSINKITVSTNYPHTYYFGGSGGGFSNGTTISTNGLNG